MDKIQGIMTKYEGNLREFSLLTEEMPTQMNHKFMDARAGILSEKI